MREALLRLLEERPLEAISGAMVAERAKVGYATFFRHYPDVRALVVDTVAAATDELAQSMMPALLAADSRGAANVEFKEVSGDMVRVRVNGQDTLNGLETWAPLRYVATQGTGYTIPTNGQPRGMSAKKYSVVRNPDLPAAQQPAAEQPTTGPQ